MSELPPEPAPRVAAPAAESPVSPLPSAPQATVGVSVGSMPSWVVVWRWAVIMVAVLAAVSLALSWRASRRLTELEQELVRRQQDSAVQANEARLVARDAQESVRDASAKVALLEARVAEVSVQRGQLEDLIQSLSRSRDENLLGDVEASIRVAVQQTVITGSAEPLVAALKQGDERLARYNLPRLENLRRAIGRDLDRIKSVSVTDVPSLAIKLDEAIRLVDDLPLLASSDAHREAGMTTAGSQGAQVATGGVRMAQGTLSGAQTLATDRPSAAALLPSEPAARLSSAAASVGPGSAAASAAFGASAAGGLSRFSDTSERSAAAGTSRSSGASMPSGMSGISGISGTARTAGISGISGAPGAPVASSTSMSSDTSANGGSTFAHWRATADGWWRAATGAAWSELRSLIRVTRVDHPDAMLLAPEQAFFVRENLKLRLLNARLALLSRQFDTVQSDLAVARTALDRYFERGAKRTVVLAELIAQVSAQARQVNVPRPDDTLAALTAAGAGR